MISEDNYTEKFHNAWSDKSTFDYSIFYDSFSYLNISNEISKETIFSGRCLDRSESIYEKDAYVLCPICSTKLRNFEILQHFEQELMEYSRTELNSVKRQDPDSDESDDEQITNKRMKPLPSVSSRQQKLREIRTNRARRLGYTHRRYQGSPSTHLESDEE